MRRPGPAIWGLLILLVAAQIAFGRAVAPLRPGIEEMPAPLGRVTLAGLAFGDQQFLFRAIGLWLQDVGDGGGRMRPLREYDYDRVVGWLQLLDGMDDQSDYAFSLAAHYFGALTDPTEGPRRVAKVVEYVRRSALKNPERRWPWLVWAVTKTQTVVKDRDLALRLGGDLVALRGNPATPAWLTLLAPPMYRLAGDEGAAHALDTDPALLEQRRVLWEEMKRALGQ